MVMYGYEIETKEKFKTRITTTNRSFIHCIYLQCYAEIKNSNKGIMAENSYDLIAFKATRRSR